MCHSLQSIVPTHKTKLQKTSHIYTNSLYSSLLPTICTEPKRNVSGCTAFYTGIYTDTIQYNTEPISLKGTVTKQPV